MISIFRCEIRPTHAGSKYVLSKFVEHPSLKREKWKKGCMVKSRNEPCCIKFVYYFRCLKNFFVVQLITFDVFKIYFLVQLITFDVFKIFFFGSAFVIIH